jgi:hypothetical protein
MSLLSSAGGVGGGCCPLGRRLAAGRRARLRPHLRLGLGRCALGRPFRRPSAALVGELVAVVAEFVTPVFAGERPELVLVIDVDGDDVLGLAVAVFAPARSSDPLPLGFFSPSRISNLILVTRIDERREVR